MAQDDEQVQTVAAVPLAAPSGRRTKVMPVLLQSTRFVIPVTNAAGAGHRFAAMMMGKLIADKYNLSFALDPSLWTTPAAAHHSSVTYEFMVELFNLATIPWFAPGVAGLHVPQLQDVSSTYDGIQYVGTGTSTFCGGDYCFWKNGYEISRKFWREQYLSTFDHALQQRCDDDAAARTSGLRRRAGNLRR